MCNDNISYWMRRNKEYCNKIVIFFTIISLDQALISGSDISFLRTLMSKISIVYL
jgi:hypothetical protein